MTLRQAIRAADEMRPNTLSDEIKCRWLSRLDGSIRAEAMDGAETETGADGANTEDETVLLVPEPYDAVYEYWLAAQLDLSLGELLRYANDMALYNAALAEYAAAWRRAHTPAKRGQFRL